MTGSRPADHAAGSFVPVGDLRRAPGSRRELHRSFPAEGIGLPDVTVPDGSIIDFDGRIESVSDGVVLAGTITVPWRGACRRCLEDVEGVAVADVEEVWSVHPLEEDHWLLENDEIELDPILRDAALLALPLAPLCADDCLGPAPDAFPTGIPDEDAEPKRDPRWAALDDLDLEG